MKKIAFICDLHLEEKNPELYGVDPKINWKRILEDIKQRNINTIVFGGDIGASSSYAWFFKSLESFDFQVILGNHDTHADTNQYFRRGTDKNELYFSSHSDVYKFIFLDSSSKKVSQRQLKWLAKELNTELKIIIFIHHPVLAVDTPIDRKHPLQNREEIFELLQQSNKSITLFSGHYHMNDERTIGKLRQIITHSSAFQVIKEASEIVIDASIFGYRIITFGEESIPTEIVSMSDVNS